MARVVLFQSISQYQSLNTMAREIADAWAERGIEPRIINLRRAGYQAIAEALSDGEVRAVLTISGYGIVDPYSKDRLFALYRAAGVPVVSLYFDPLPLYLDQVRAPVPRRLVTTTSDAEIDYWRACDPPPADIRHLPHGAPPAPVPDWDQRDIPLLFSGTGPQDPERMRTDWAAFGTVIEDHLNRILDVYLAAATPRSLTAIIAEALEGRYDVSEPARLQPYFAAFDFYLRARLRWRMISDLAERPLTVVGDGWEALAERLAERPRCRIRFLPAQEAGAVRALIGRSRLVLNICTPHHGSHERVFHALAAGTPVLSSQTGWLAREAPADALALVNVERDSPRERAEALADAPDHARTMAETGRRWFLEHHTWQHRLDTLETWISELHTRPVHPPQTL
jgi:glycosyltransferase involved in cell wall biosynthesis